MTVTQESVGDNGEVFVALSSRFGQIRSDLSIGANVVGALVLRAQSQLSNRGVIPHGAGFLVQPQDTEQLASSKLLRPYRNGKDLTDRPRGIYVIDTFDLELDELRAKAPAAFQWLLDRVKPERDHNPRPKRRERWWRFAEDQKRMRESIAGLKRYIATPYVSKHRPFTFVEGEIMPDDMLITIGSDSAIHLGVLSSQIHIDWALAKGSVLEDRPRYNKTLCFETFPFPELEATSAVRISQLAEELDAFRKARQAAHESVTLTGMYNVLDKLRREEPLNAKDKALHEQALVGVLRTLHDELDAAVLQAYGWQDLGPVPWSDDEARQAWTERLLERLVDLNTRRAAEEARGTIRWLRPEFQDPARRHAAPATPATQADIELVGGSAVPPADAAAPDTDEDSAPAATATATPATRQPWPADLPEQMRAVADTLATSAQPLDLDALAARFTGRGPWKKRLPQILETLAVLGRASRDGAGAWRGGA